MPGPHDFPDSLRPHSRIGLEHRAQDHQCWKLMTPAELPLYLFEPSRSSKPLGTHISVEIPKRLCDLVGDSFEVGELSDGATTEVIDRAEEELLHFVGRLTPEVERIEVVLVKTAVRTQVTNRLALMCVSALNDSFG